MIDNANRLYALDLLHRAGTAYDARDISVIASILPLVEADVAEWIDPVDSPNFSLADEIRRGAHRPNSEPPGSLTSRPGQPAAAPATVHAGGGGPSGD